MLLALVFMGILVLLAGAGLFVHRRQYAEASYLVIAAVVLLLLFIFFGHRIGV